MAELDLGNAQANNTISIALKQLTMNVYDEAWTTEIVRTVFTLTWIYVSHITTNLISSYFTIT